MKKILLSLVVLTSLHATPMALVAKVIPSDNQGYFIFSDGTFWKVSAFVKRWRGPLEWLTGAELMVPSEYDCKVDQWSFADDFEPYPKYDYLRANEADASNEEQLKAHSHLLVNKCTGKVLFATPIHPADFTNQLYQEGYDKGFSAGYATGHDAGYKTGREFAERRAKYNESLVDDFNY
jgi:hypothetical protein